MSTTAFGQPSADYGGEWSRVGVAPGTVTLELPDGGVVGLIDYIDDRLWATIEYSTADNARLEAFVVGGSGTIVGGARPTTRVDTNVPRGSDAGLPQDWGMFVYGVGVDLKRVHRDNTQLGVAANASADPDDRTWFNFNERVRIDYEYNERKYVSGTLQDFPQGGGVVMYSTAANLNIAHNGIPSPRDRTSLFIPVYMRMGLSFKVTYQPEAALIINQPPVDGGANYTNLDVVARLWGLIGRTVVPAS